MTALYTFLLPGLGEGVVEGEIVEWLVDEGSAVEVDQPLVEVCTDKAIVVVPSPVEGFVRRLHARLGELVAVGGQLVSFELATGGRVPVALHAAGPVARRNRNGHVAEGDLRAIATGGPAPNRRSLLEQRLAAALAVPAVTNADSADFEAVRAAGVPALCAVAWATVHALQDHPRVNGAPADARTAAVHLGVAAQTDAGIVVPVVRHAERLGVAELEAAVLRTTERARTGRVTPGELQGATFTIRSAGTLAGRFATPLLNRSNVATLGLHRVELQPVVRDGAVVPRLCGMLTVTFDHRALDELEAAYFLQRVITAIEQWGAASTT